MKNLINRILNHFGYYKVSDLTHWGHCGMCGVSMEGVFTKDWNWGICESCNNEI